MFVRVFILLCAVFFIIGLTLNYLGHPYALQVISSVIIGLILSLFAGSILIRFIVKPLADQLETDPSGLKEGGRYIGYLERAMIMLLVLIGEPSGVGFLIAAKSILRFGEVKEPGQRRMSEYIIIGTFMSFGWGMFIAILTRMSVEALTR